MFAVGPGTHPGTSPTSEQAGLRRKLAWSWHRSLDLQMSRSGGARTRRSSPELVRPCSQRAEVERQRVVQHREGH